MAIDYVNMDDLPNQAELVVKEVIVAPLTKPDGSFYKDSKDRDIRTKLLKLKGDIPEAGMKDVTITNSTVRTRSGKRANLSFSNEAATSDNFGKVSSTSLLWAFLKQYNIKDEKELKGKKIRVDFVRGVDSDGNPTRAKYYHIWVPERR